VIVEVIQKGRLYELAKVVQNVPPRLRKVICDIGNSDMFIGKMKNQLTNYVKCHIKILT
jgi:hypothetical protein